MKIELKRKKENLPSPTRPCKTRGEATEGRNSKHKGNGWNAEGKLKEDKAKNKR